MNHATAGCLGDGICTPDIRDLRLAKWDLIVILRSNNPQD
jgi:hypothetical protein